jgi:hypothetical protein
MFEEFKSLERPPRDPVIKILCFRIFNDMSTNKEDYLMRDEVQKDQFLKAKVPDLVDAYEEFFAQEIKVHFRELLNFSEGRSFGGRPSEVAPFPCFLSLKQKEKPAR